MSEEKEVKLPYKWLKYVFLFILAMGITLYVSWTIIYLIPQKDYFDIGIFSLSLCIAMFGLVGAWLYSNLEKKEREENKAKESKK
jgi:hypothetical protein